MKSFTMLSRPMRFVCDIFASVSVK